MRNIWALERYAKRYRQSGVYKALRKLMHIDYGEFDG